MSRRADNELAAPAGGWKHVEVPPDTWDKGIGRKAKVYEDDDPCPGWLHMLFNQPDRGLRHRRIPEKDRSVRWVLLFFGVLILLGIGWGVFGQRMH